MNVLAFPAATGNDQQAAEFATYWMNPTFDQPYAIDSRLIDGLWVHQLYEPQPDQAELRAQLAATWKHKADLEAEEWPT